MKLISIITPVYNEEQNIKDCHLAVKNVFQTKLKDYNYEHIFADNASTDNGLKILKEIAANDKKVKVIVNSRNFGASKSSFNCLLYSNGDAVVYTIAADLQDPPDLIPSFINKWETGYQIVYGVRESREENKVLTFMRKKYYRMVSSLSEFEIPNDVGDFQLLDKKVVDNLKKYDDYFPYVRGLIAQTGFESTGIKYRHKKRIRGKAKGTLYPIIDLGINGLVSFTNIPLRIATIGGFLISVLSILFALVQFVLWIVNKLFFDKTTAAPGLATLILGMFLFFGITLFFIGILGEYIGAIHAQVRKGPTVVVKETININDHSN